MRLSTILFSAGLVLSQQAFADEIEKAKKEMAAGGKDFDAGNCKSALVHFTAASNYAPEAAGPHRELGKTLECLEKYEEAQREYELYLKMKPDAPDTEDVKKYIEDVKKKIIETSVDPIVPTNSGSTNGKLSFTVDKGAKVFIDDKALDKGQIKSGYSIAEGKYQLRIEKKGFETISKEIEVVAGETLSINEALVASADETPDEPATKKSKVPAFVSFGVAGAGAGLGIFAGLQALQVEADLQEFEDKPIPLDEFEEFVQQGQLFNALTIAGYAVAGVGVGAGIFFLARKGKPSDEASATLRVTPTIGGATATLKF
jgi:tetratricopeptide (TPR) repeat protein